MIDAESHQTDAAAPKRPRWRRRVLLGLMVLALASGLYVWLLLVLAERSWRAAVAETDQLDPGWRLEELEAKRAAIPDAQNAALRLLDAHRAFPEPWPAWPTSFPATDPFFDAVRLGGGPEVRLEADRVKSLAAALQAADAALGPARTLKDLPYGRFPAIPSQQPLLTAWPRLPQVRRVATLLAYDTLVRASAGDGDAALESCRALLNTARSVGDDPEFILQIHRLELRSAVCRLIEWSLTQGRPSAAALEATQKLLELEEPEPVFLVGARGFRAWLDELFEDLQAGKVSAPGFHRWAGVGLARTSRPDSLQMTTRVVELAKRPLPEQPRALREEFPKPLDVSFLTRMYIMPKLEKITHDLSEGQMKSQAELRCAIAALAAERYRRAHHAWPVALSDLVPRFLAAVPTDPFDGKPVRLRQTAEGIVVYCLGPDGTDDGGTIDPTKPKGLGTDLGIRLGGERKE